MSIDDSELEKQLLSLSVPKKSALLEERILALAVEPTSQVETPLVGGGQKSTWKSFFSSLFLAPQAAMAFSLILCCGLWMGWVIPSSDSDILDANTLALMSNSNAYFSYDEVVSSDGIYEGDLF